jgi:hypothetical protein
MPIVVEHVGRLRLYEEPNGSFAVDNTANLDSAFVDVPFVEGSLKMDHDQPMESPAFAMQQIDRKPRSILLPRRGGISFDVRLAALGHSASGQRPQSALGRLLKIVMGGEQRQTPTTIASTSTTTVLNVTSAAGLSVGGAIACATGAGGRFEAREIKTIATNVVTVKHAFSSIPANGSTVYASATYHLGSGQGDVMTSAQLSYKGLSVRDRWNFYGAQATSVDLNLPNGGQPTMSFNFGAANWEQDGDSVAVANATYANTVPLVLKDSEFSVHDASANDYSTIAAAEQTMKLAIAHEPVMTPGGTNNILQWMRSRVVPVITGEFAFAYDQASTGDLWFDIRDVGYTGVECAVNLQIGSGAAGCALLSAPAAQIISAKREPLGGIAGQRIGWEGSTDNTTTDSYGSTLRSSAFRIHLF